MLFLNLSSFKYFSLLLIGSLAIIFTSCGTAERTIKAEREAVKKNGSAFPDDKTANTSEDEPVYPPSRTLVSPTEKDVEEIRLIENGRASWYGPNFHGKLTANGEKFDMNAITAAHRTLPFNTLVLVENMDSGKSVVVRVNDRGPFAKNRIIDLSKKAAQEVDMIEAGVANVKLYVAKKSVDNAKITNLKVPTYTVQLGSFDTKAQAFNYSAKIEGSRVEIVRKKNKKIYRVYYGLFIDKNEAVKKQKDLERKNFSGYVKQVENS